MTVKVETRNGSDCYTGWGQSYTLEAEEIPVPFPNNALAVLQLFGDVDDSRNVGYVNRRVLTFTKKEASTVMRFLYSDNLRVGGNGKWCKWEIRIDDKACPSRTS